MSQSSDTVEEFVPEASRQTAVDNRKSSYNHNKLRKRLRRLTGQAIADYNMIEEGDRVMVCLSGGKDSYTMLDILFTFSAVHLFNSRLSPSTSIRSSLASLNMYYLSIWSHWGCYYVLERDTYSVVSSVIPEWKTTCGLCSRLRRGTLYGFAEEIGAHKIALGHHRDDIVETLFLNLFFGGKLKAMPPKLLSDDKKNVVIRPLAYCKESDIEAYANQEAYPIIPCNLCGSQENLQRVEVKRMLRDWEKQYPGRTETIFKSLANVSPSQLADRELFDFEALVVQRDDSHEPELPLIKTVSL